MDANRLYICGTNAHSPKDYIIFVSLKDNLFCIDKLFFENSILSTFQQQNVVNNLVGVQALNTQEKLFFLICTNQNFNQL